MDKERFQHTQKVSVKPPCITISNAAKELGGSRTMIEKKLSKGELTPGFITATNTNVVVCDDKWEKTKEYYKVKNQAKGDVEED